MATPSPPSQWLIAVFPDVDTAQKAARHVRDAGAPPDLVRVGDSLDALASVGGEMREETVHVPAAPVPFTRETVHGFAFGTVVGAIVGVVVALPFAAIHISDLAVQGRLVLFGAVGLLFGSFLGWFLGGAIGINRPDEDLAASRGVTLAAPDSEAARRSIRADGPIRLDITGAEGQPIDTIVSDDPSPTEIGSQLAQHASEEARPD